MIRFLFENVNRTSGVAYLILLDVVSHVMHESLHQSLEVLCFILSFWESTETESLMRNYSSYYLWSAILVDCTLGGTWLDLEISEKKGVLPQLELKFELNLNSCLQVMPQIS